jgi:hypothetical protein
MGVFAPILPQLAQPGCNAPTGVRDLFLHALFARLALNDNSNVEFETKYNPQTNTIELQLPDCALPFFDTVTGMQQGPRFRAYIDWLIGNANITAGGLIDADLTVTGNAASTAEQILSTVTIPANTLSSGIGVRIKAWGTFGLNKYLKTLKLKFGATVVMTNDLVIRPSGNSWSLEATVFQKIGEQESIGEGTLGAVSQGEQVTQPTEDETQPIDIKLTGKVSSPIPDSIICRGLTVERI